ncbi:transposase [Escherichia coli]|nr:transposase [Escherichia coli]GDJ56762.1 transposase [Escherichia coli]GDJ98304.1 transposase [Escherichia coli]GDK59481.1 transposase [Escherichia coli]GDL21348.1 transposase [Escherichia coli]
METCFKVLQLKFDRKLSNRTIGLTLNISPSTVFEVLARFKASSTPWPLPETLTPEAIESLIFPEKKASVLTPLTAYEYTEFRAVKVAPDYHVEYARHWYSVPHELVGQRLSLKAGQTVIQVWYRGECVAQHPRSHLEYKTRQIRYTCRKPIAGTRGGHRKVFWISGGRSALTPDGRLKPC